MPASLKLTPSRLANLPADQILRLLGDASGVSPDASFFRATPFQVDEILTDGQILPVLGGLRVIDTPGHILHEPLLLFIAKPI